MSNFYQFVIRTSSFFGKEIAEVVRQPRLILTLVLGPFLILLLFGVGYKNEPRTVRTIFVVDPKTEFARQVQQQAPTISPQLIYGGIVPNVADAKQRLSAGQVDLVVVVPNNAIDAIQHNQQAVFKLYHNEIDPAQIGYIQYLGEIYVQEVNRRILSTMAKQGQTEASDIQKNIQSARKNISTMKSALAAGDTATARAQQGELKTHLSALSLMVGASAGLLNGIEQSMTSPTSSQNDPQDAMALLNQINNSPSNTKNIQDGQTNYNQEISDLDTTDKNLANLQTKLGQFQQISPDILISPFSSDTQSINPIQLTPLDFFAPGVIVLLLQHIAVTIASLSIVREKRSGTMELFRVSPVSAAEAMLGKYISYMIFGSFLAVILGLLLVYGLKIPMFGRWSD
jgi:ABC-2 type transport system permease protein